MSHLTSLKRAPALCLLFHLFVSQSLIFKQLISKRIRNALKITINLNFSKEFLDCKTLNNIIILHEKLSVETNSNENCHPMQSLSFETCNILQQKNVTRWQYVRMQSSREI